MAISPSPFDRIERNRRAPSRLWLLWVVLAALLITGAIFFRQQAAQIFWNGMAPLLRLRESLSAGEATRLRAELAAAQARLSDRDALYDENLHLKARLGRADTGAPRVVAGVLMRPPFVPYDTLLVDAGAAQGVALGDRVSAGGGAFIGTVVEVYDATARVELFSAPGASYQATLNGSLPVVVEGQGGGSMVAQVPAGTQVAVGDTIQFPGLLGGVVAHVSAVDAKAGESFIVIYMALPANPAHLRLVEILTQP